MGQGTVPGIRALARAVNLTPEQISCLQQLEQQHGIIALACQK
jgi:hypothetical protein